MTTHDTPAESDAGPVANIGMAGSGATLRPVAHSGPLDPGGDPFISLSATGSSLRTYLAEIHVGDVPSGRTVSLMMEPNHYEDARPGSSTETGNNEQIARNWKLGFAAARIAGRGLAALEPLGVPRVAEGSAPTHRPLAYCRKTGRFAIPLCPETLEPLQTCRDEALLRRSGLPSYRDTLSRFLYSPAAIRPGRPITFYTFSLARYDPSPEVIVRRRGEVYRDLLPRIQDGTIAIEKSGSSPQGHPCFVCEHRNTCYPAGSTLDRPIPAEELLHPFAYYEFFYIPRTPLLLASDEAAALLGGAPILETLSSREFRRELEKEPQGKTLAEALSPPRQQFFFEGDRSGLFVLECLYLKLSAISGVLHGLIDLYRNAGRPHLGLSPGRLRASYRTVSAHLPARWSIDLQITDAVSTAPLTSLDRERVPGEPVVWAIPQPRMEAFLPTAMLKPQLQTLSMRTEVRALELKAEGDRSALILDARLVSEAYLPADHGQHDLVRVITSAPERVVFGGRMQEASPGSFRFIGRTVPLEPEPARKLQEHLDGRVVEVVIGRAFGAPSDLVSLGRLFLRMLFWNDRQDALRLEPARLDRVSERIAAAASEPGSEAARSSAPGLRAALEPEQLAFGPESVLYRAEDRDSLGSSSWGTAKQTSEQGVVPDPLWNEVWLCALRMATTTPGFSFCARLDEYGAADPAAPLERAARTVDGLAERCRGALIGSSGRNNIALDVCHDFWRDVQEAARAGTGEDAAERTMMVSRPRR